MIFLHMMKCLFFGTTVFFRFSRTTLFGDLTLFVPFLFVLPPALAPVQSVTCTDCITARHTADLSFCGFLSSSLGHASAILFNR